MAYELVETVTLATASSSISFTSIPQDAMDLCIVFSLRSTRSAQSTLMGWALNSGGSYGYLRLRGTGSGNEVLTGSEPWPSFANAADSTANTFGNGAIYISDYATSRSKMASIDSMTETNASSADMAILSGNWSGTSAVTSVTISEYLGSNWAANSTASLYKIY